MEKGRHFALNHESSRLQTEIYVYDYLHLNSRDGDEIHVEFSSEGVRFNLHQFEDAYFSGCVLFLPMSLDMDFRTELTTTLNSAMGMTLTGCEFEAGEVGDMYYAPEVFGATLSPSPFPMARLLLDFMFEMEHGTLFKQDPLFETVYSALHSHPLYNAIVQKADYDFYKRCCQDQEDSFALDYLVRTERRWVETLVSNSMDLVFHESPWFKDSVDELKEVYMAEDAASDRRLEASQAEKSKQTSAIATRWFMGKYRPDGVLCITHGGKYRHWLNGILVCLGLLVGLIFWHSFQVGKWYGKQLREVNIFRVLLIVFGLFFLALVFIPGRRRKDNVNWRGAGVSILMPRLFAAIAAGWMTVGLSDIWVMITDKQEHYLTRFSNLFPAVTFIVTIFLLSFLYFSVHRIIPFMRSRSKALVSISLFSISFVYSVIIGSALFRLYSGGRSMFLFADAPAKVKTLVVFSFLSMFVGVFIQLLFQEKSISSTED